jgi:hypothetical protein
VDDVIGAGQGMGRREYMRVAKALAMRSEAERTLRGNGRWAVQLVLSLTVIALALGAAAVIFGWRLF